MRTDRELTPPDDASPGAREDAFGELRSLLQGAPDAARWEAVCGHLMGLSDAAMERALPYAEGLLRAWPDALRTPPAGWLDRALAADTLWQPWRLVRTVRLSRRARWRGDDDPIARLLRPDTCGHLTRLTLEGFCIDSAQARLLGAPQVIGRLTHLSLHRVELDARGWRALTGSRALGALVALRITDTPLHLDRARALSRAPWLPGLRALELSRADVSARRLAEVLDGADTRHTLRALRLRGHALGDDLGHALGRLGDDAALERLDLSSGSLGVEGLRAWLDACALPQLRALDLSHTALSPDVLRALTAPQRLPRLDALSARGLVWAPRHEALLRALTAALPSLRHLYLSEPHSLRAPPGLTLHTTPCEDDHELW